MAIKVNITFYPSKNPNTIWNTLARKLGREPTHAEASAEVRRILREASIDDDRQGSMF